MLIICFQNHRPFCNYYLEITLTKHKKLNLDRKPCEESLDYSFTNCIKQQISNQVNMCKNIQDNFFFKLQVGCKMSWDRNSTHNQICDNMEQMRSVHQNIDFLKRHLLTAVRGIMSKSWGFFNTREKAMISSTRFCHSAIILSITNLKWSLFYCSKRGSWVVACQTLHLRSTGYQLLPGIDMSFCESENYENNNNKSNDKKHL